MYPPVDTDFYTPDDPLQHLEQLSVVSALVPYKRLDVAIEACRRVGAPLRIVGTGPETARLEAWPGRASSSWAGSRTRRSVSSIARRGDVLLPGVEDFGIVPVEAQACGRPVVALGKAARGRR